MSGPRQAAAQRRPGSWLIASTLLPLVRNRVLVVLHDHRALGLYTKERNKDKSEFSGRVLLHPSLSCFLAQVPAPPAAMYWVLERRPHRSGLSAERASQPLGRLARGEAAPGHRGQNVRRVEEEGGARRCLRGAPSVSIVAVCTE